MKGELDNVVLGWRNTEAENAILGAGISRPKPGQKTRMYRVRVIFKSARPMTALLPAPSRRDVIRYVKNRWPDAECVVEGLVSAA